MLSQMIVFAQDDNNLTKIEIDRIDKFCDSYPNIKPGEFKVDFKNKVYEAGSRSSNYKYFIIVRDINDSPRIIIMNNEVMNFANKELPIDILRVGYTPEECVYITKDRSSTSDKEKIVYNLIVGDKSYGPYDGIETVLPKGFVYKNKNLFTYVEYFKEFSSINNYNIVEEAEYEGEFVQCSLNDKMLKFVPKAKVSYFKCYDGHYYILYNDEEMNNTLLIVDGVGYELDGVVGSLNFKFSHDGEHWIASGNDYVIVDGVYVARLSETIKDVAINEKGDYIYIIDGEGFTEKAYFNENVIANGVEFMSLNVDDEQMFNFIFRNEKGYFYGIDNDIKDFNVNMKNYYYPALYDTNQAFVVKSSDGKHKMEFNYESPYVVIDNNKFESVTPPHYAVWNDDEHCFMWNTVENYKLMVYKYKVK